MNINTPSKAVYSSTREVGRRFLLHSMRKRNVDDKIPPFLRPSIHYGFVMVWADVASRLSSSK